MEYVSHRLLTGLPGWDIDPSEDKRQHKYKINTDINVSRVIFEPTIPLFELPNLLSMLDHVTAMIGKSGPFFFHWHYSPSGPRPTSMKLSVSL
jgi:hypothetical protein